MNKVNPKKLLHSKWTAVNPQSKELHFVVVGRICQPKGVVQQVELKAILTGNTYRFAWQGLKDDTIWQMGWR